MHALCGQSHGKKPSNLDFCKEAPAVLELPGREEEMVSRAEAPQRWSPTSDLEKK